MTGEEFMRSESLRRELGALLETEVFKRATEAILLDEFPQATNLGLATPDVGNGRFQQLAGMRHVINRLHRLARGVPEPKTLSEPKFWTDADIEELKKLREQQQQ
jgi:hypothetical protein